MSVYLLPSSLCDEIEKMMNSYWWGTNNTNNNSNGSIQWMSWDRLTVCKAEGGLGFRQLEAFNIAMLGKQAWKFISQPYLLVSRLMKAKYFPKNYFLQADIRSNPSFVWWSLWHTKPVLSAGCRWRIGTGNTIPISYSVWLKGEGPQHIIEDSQGVLKGVYVNHLLIPGCKQWNATLIYSLFDAPVAERILTVPLYDSVQLDKLLWNLSNTGDDTVKSAYHIFRELFPQEQHVATPGNWRALWKLDVPPKIKTFLWRCYRHVIPTRDRLIDRRVQCPGDCIRCQAGNESIMHALITCPFSKSVWMKEGLWHQISSSLDRYSVFKDLFFDLYNVFSIPQFLNFAMVLWSLWIGRNALLWEGTVETSQTISSRAKSVWDEWHLARIPMTSSAPRNIQASADSWLKPPAGFLACNVDAAFPSNTRATAIGMCLRGESSDFLLAKTEWQAQRLEVKEGEAWGLLRALSWACELELSHVVFQLDSKLVVDSIDSRKNDLSEFGCMISQIRETLSAYPNFKVEFARRQTNVAAHLLAGAATSWPSPHVSETVPICIGDVIDHECNEFILVKKKEITIVRATPLNNSL